MIKNGIFDGVIHNFDDNMLPSNRFVNYKRWIWRTIKWKSLRAKDEYQKSNFFVGN